jgi:uncharacterized membrane protein YoaK (UPF0700 family)
MAFPQKGFRLSLNTWIRRVHRWLSIAFTAAVVANFVAMGLGEPSLWVVYAPLPPLFLLMFTGLYMFALPYAAKGRSGRGAVGQKGWE